MPSVFCKTLLLQERNMDFRILQVNQQNIDFSFQIKDTLGAYPRYIVYSLPEFFCGCSCLSGNVGVIAWHLRDKRRVGVHIDGATIDRLHQSGRDVGRGGVAPEASVESASDAVLRVPPVAAGCPRQLSGSEGHEHVVEGPGHDDIVVDTDNAGHQHHAKTNTYNIHVHTSQQNAIKPSGYIQCQGFFRPL